MRVRSTGLGKQQMKARIRDVQLIKKDSLIMNVETQEPVQWHIRIVMGHDDFIRLIPQILKPKTLFGVLKLILFKKGDCNPEGEW